MSGTALEMDHRHQVVHELSGAEDPTPTSRDERSRPQRVTPTKPPSSSVVLVRGASKISPRPKPQGPKEVPAPQDAGTGETSRPGDPDRARLAYQWHAPGYDIASSVGELVRQRAIEALDPAPGEVILDVGCGTGLNFPAIRTGVGDDGHIVGLDLSPSMLERARERVERSGWDNVTLLEGGAEEAKKLDVQADAALLCLTHDVMRDPRGLATVVRQVRPGGRVVAAGPKWADWWAIPVNFATWWVNLAYVTTFEGFHRPWDHLARMVVDLRVDTLAEYFGGAYVARARVPSRGQHGAKR